MMDLHSAFRNFSPEIDAKELGIDSAFITDFLVPYFRDLPREQLEAKLAEIISRELDRAGAARLR